MNEEFMYKLKTETKKYLFIGIAIGLLIAAGYLAGQRNGHLYVREYYEEYTDNNCVCINRTITKVTPLFLLPSEISDNG